MVQKKTPTKNRMDKNQHRRIPRVEVMIEPIIIDMLTPSQVYLISECMLVTYN